MSLRGAVAAAGSLTAFNASAVLAASRALSSSSAANDAQIQDVVLDLFIESTTALAIAWVTAAISVVLTAHLVYRHLQYYNLPLLQRQIIRIVLMVPIYGVLSALSLTQPHWSVYLATVRDIYEVRAGGSVTEERQQWWRRRAVGHVGGCCAFSCACAWCVCRAEPSHPLVRAPRATHRSGLREQALVINCFLVRRDAARHETGLAPTPRQCTRVTVSRTPHPGTSCRPPPPAPRSK